jgi:hypothetical protein
MEKAACGTCLVAQTTLRCGLCEEPSCKTCAHFLELDAFSFLPKVPDLLTKGVYCHGCFQAKIAAEVETYEKTMEAARRIDVYFKDQGKETRLIRREAPPFVIEACADRDELVLRFAFLAAQAGFTMLIEVDIVGKKVRHNSYQTTVYRGTAIPANARPRRAPKER